MSEKVPVDLVRLREHAKAAVSLSEARDNFREAQERSDMLSVGEHPEVLEDAEHEVSAAYDALVAATSVERRAYLAYTNPFRVDKHSV